MTTDTTESPKQILRLGLWALSFCQTCGQSLITVLWGFITESVPVNIVYCDRGKHGSRCRPWTWWMIKPLLSLASQNRPNPDTSSEWPFVELLLSQALSSLKFHLRFQYQGKDRISQKVLTGKQIQPGAYLEIPCHAPGGVWIKGKSYSADFRPRQCWCSTLGA